MTLKILALGDTADNIISLKKFSKNLEIHLINFPRKQNALLTHSTKGVEFFDSLLISKQVEKVNQIKNKFDLCLVMSWAAARIAYLANLNYVMYFVGDDIIVPPFIKQPKISYLSTPILNHNLIERKFYKRILNKAIACIAPTSEYFNELKKYRKDAIRMDRIFVDVELFNEHIKPNLNSKEKFTFLSAQRFGLEKGFDVIWNALPLCKTDFQVLQVKWFIERTEEEKEINRKLLEKIPKQVKFIPLIKRENLARYFMSADAILGQMRAGIQGGIERDAANCKKPVICYTDVNKKSIIDGEEIIPPFLPNSKNPKELALLIDKIVESKEFRDNLSEKEYEYIKKISEPNNVAHDWEKVLEKIHMKCSNINRKDNIFRMKVENLFANFIEEVYYRKKMKNKNIQAWGKDNYQKLTN